MDIKNSEKKYALTAGIDNFDMQNIKQSISILTQDIVPYEFRTTTVNELHAEEDFKEIAEMLASLSGGKKVSKYFLQPFCDRDTVIFGNLSAPDKTALNAFKEALISVCKEVSLRGT